MSADAARPRHVLLLHCHDLGRFLGCYGVPTVHTPSLDRLAADGVRFDRAFCTAPQCSPSRASLFSGYYPQTTGVLGLTHHGWDLEVPHVGRRLAEAGFHTELVGIQHEATPRPDGEMAARLGFDLVDTLPPGTTERRAEAVADRTIAALRERAQNPDQPFYLQAGFLEPHRIPGRDFDGITMGFLGDHIPPDADADVTVPGFLQDDEGSRAEIAELQAAVTYLDAEVGRVLAALEESGLAQDTLVLFTTDHGLALPRAKGTLYDSGLETALIARAPRLGWTGGQVREDLVSNVDVVPTLLEALGLDVPEVLPGRSLVAPARAREHVFGQFTFHDYYEPMRCVRTDRYKLIVNLDHALTHAAASTQSWRPRSTPLAPTLDWNRPKVELYDLAADPLEVTNLADDPGHAEVREELRAELLAWMRSVEDPLLDGPVASPTYRSSLATLQQAGPSEPGAAR